MGFAKLLASRASVGVRLQGPYQSCKGGFSVIGNCRFCTKGSQDATAFSESSTSSSGSESDEESNGESKINDIKNQILTAALDHVSKLGWTYRAIAAGAESVGYPGAAHGMFSRGGIELVNHFYSGCNEKLAQELSSSPVPPERTQQQEGFLRKALEMRLRMILPHVDTWTQALSLMVLPANIPDATRNLQILVDDVWYYAGDRSSDFSWYTKRVGLAAVYVSTQLVLVQDKSLDHAETWTFLDRRIKQLEAANRGFTEKQAFTEGLPVFLQASMITLTNILGLRNTFRRQAM